MKWFRSKPPSAIARVTKKDTAVIVRKTNNPSSVDIKNSSATTTTPSKSNGYDIDGFDS
jgi:hypothetical protein